jgi:hypothetical protein
MTGRSDAALDGQREWLHWRAEAARELSEGE